MNSNLQKQIYPVIDAVRKAVEIDADWDVASDYIMLNFYILRAAQNVERFEPFSTVEQALNDYLTCRMAGKRLCDYAWRVFAQSYRPESFSKMCARSLR